MPEDRYERLFATAKDGILILDAASGEILDANPRIEEMFGYDADVLIGKRLSEERPFAEAGIAERILYMEPGMDTVQFEAELSGTGGQWQPCEFLCNRYSEGGREVVQSNIRNIAKRRSEEKQLRDRDSHFRLLREGVKDYAIILLNAAGQIVSWNRRAEQIFGYGEAEILGQMGHVIFTAEDQQNGQPEKEKETALAQGWADDERWHVRKDRTRFMATGILTALRNEHGHPQGFVEDLARYHRAPTSRTVARAGAEVRNHRGAGGWSGP